MGIWIIPLLTAIGGAIAALIGKELIECFKRPRLKIDFEAQNGQKPFIIDVLDVSQEALALRPTMRSFKFLRLNVHNSGKRTATNCEVKIQIIEVTNEGKKITGTSCHWSRRDPRIYIDLDKIYSPIDLNPNDDEPVDIIRIIYKHFIQVSHDAEKTDAQLEKSLIYTVSPSPIELKPKTGYVIRVTVYASNTTSKPFIFNVNWDGKVEGFQEAFTKETNA